MHLDEVKRKTSMNGSLTSKSTCILKTKQKENGEKHMKNSVILKSLMAVTVLTTATGSALFVGNGITHEAKAQQENPNAEHFTKNVNGQTLDFSDTFSKPTLSAKSLANEIESKLKEKGLDPTQYSFILKVKTSSNGIIEGNGKVIGDHLNNQTKEFNPTKDKVEVFDIVKTQ